ncbi:Mitochondrial coenzyme A transporter SLC25A42 [Linum grandiflorum]
MAKNSDFRVDLELTTLAPCITPVVGVMSGFLKEAKTVFILVELYDALRFQEANFGYFGALNNLKEQLPTDREFAHLADRNSSSLMSLVRDGREFLVRVATFGQVNFDPLFTKFTVYPLAGLIILPFVETAILPLTRFTILNQVNSEEWKTIQRQIDKVYKILHEQGGYNGLWDGKSLSILHRLAFYATKFFAYFGFKSLLQGTFGQLSLNPVTACICGGLSTLVATFVSHPLDTLRTRVEAQTSRHCYGARAMYDKIYRDGHFRSLYAGLLPSLLSSILSMTMTVTSYESLIMAWQGCMRLNDFRFMTSLVSSILAGLAASTATFPMEVVKRRMQMEGKEESNNLKAIGEKYKEIVEKDGVGGLYRGIQPHCFKVVVDNALSFVTYEILRLPCCLATIGLGFMFGMHQHEFYQ